MLNNKHCNIMMFCNVYHAEFKLIESQSSNMEQETNTKD